MSKAEPHVSKPAHAPAAIPRPIGSPRNVVLACIGLLSLLADELPALLERSVQRGSTVLERAQIETSRRTPQAGDEHPNSSSLRGLPTHRDYETLLQQVTELEQQIDELAARRTSAA